MESVRDLLSRQRHLIIFTLGLVTLFVLVYAFRGALFPFILGLVLAHLLMPVIFWIERRLPGQGRWLKAKRITLIIAFFLLALVVAGAIGFYVVTALIDAAGDLLDSAPEFFSSALSQIEEWLESIGRGLPADLKQQLDTFVQDAGEWLGEQTQNIFKRTISLIPATIGFVFGISFLPVFLFYILKDWEKLSQGFYKGMPDWAAGHAQNVVSIIDNVLVRYFRAQIVLGFIVGTMAFIGLMLLDVKYAGVLAVFAGITEMIPIVGPWIGGGVAVVVALATTPDKAIWVAILFIAIQLLENAFLVARIQAAYLRIHPAIVIALLAIGAKLAGFWGILLAVPLTATIVEMYRYIRKTAVNGNVTLE
jgi:predicted PurR-regulated permease PerM